MKICLEIDSPSRGRKLEKINELENGDVESLEIDSPSRGRKLPKKSTPEGTKLYSLEIDSPSRGRKLCGSFRKEF